ncbi:polysulfide reductase NrfD [Metallumcola ferriviriculae]|uniref:Polysulfide reductase NrfD n=1 Tax=Metallumcola ferriviriculae TaxID=3039180 RepID=A0AAU0UQM6_9FIRM|nr:polysulfide reductase NrfD [Desulfitibacteraceae bacterium MK1]
MTGYVYPNEIEVNWGLFIVLYPYITGLVAGAFIVSSLYHVFGKEDLKPVSRLSLVSALAYLMVAPLPLLLHLGQPLRAFNILWTPNPNSAMAGFGYIYSFYMIVVLLEVWFIFREDLVHYADNSTGVTRFGYRMLTLGARDISPPTLAMDHKIVTVLAMIGIPSAAFLHGYVGFIFGAIKANALWSTPLQPVIFLMSAVVSGIALQILIYAAACKFRKRRIDMACLKTLNKFLWAFLIVDVLLEELDLLQKAYEAREAWPAIHTLFEEAIPLTHFTQIWIGAFIPIVLLIIARWDRVSNAAQRLLTIMSSAMVVIGVFAMRFNVVIGGQMISKSNVGLTSFQAHLVADEGIIPTVGILVLPLIILVVLIRILPPWLEGEAAMTGDH